MATKVLVDARIYVGGYEFSGDANQVTLAISSADVEMTPFGYGGGTKRRAGLTDASFSMQGFSDFAAGAQDVAISGSVLAVNNTPITVSDPAGSAQAEGNPAIFGRGVLLTYSPVQASVGDAATFEATGMISGVVVPGGKVLHPDTARTASGVASGLNQGTLAAGENLYSTLHVVAVAGTSPTLDVVIESDSSNSFASPTDRVTFAQTSAVGSQWGTPLSGPRTDTHYRVKYTVGGTNPSFTFIVVQGSR